jgi:acetylornithine deacetylase/succinyl-diaminopimelate desuccinylase family protein
LIQDVIALLRDLVRIPSVCGNEGEIGGFIAEWLRKNELPVQVVNVKPNRPNIVTSLKGAKPGPHVMLNGHMDTVEAGKGWIHDPFAGTVEDGRMYGRGTTDMKAGLACILWAAAKCKEEGLPRRGELTVAAVVDEEAIDLGTYALVQQGYTKGLDFAMVAESTGLQVVTAHRGRTMIEVTVHGRAAHSKWPNHGVNAIEKAAILLNALPQLRGPVHPRMGSSTVNALKIEGGQDVMMLVPDQCRLVIDRCLVPGYESRDALDEMRKLIGKLGIDAEAHFVKRETPFCEPFELSEENEYVRLISEAAMKVLGTRPNITYHEGPCDSCILVNQGKTSTVEFGPSGGRLHESDEYVEVDSVGKSAEVYLEILRRSLANS